MQSTRFHLAQANIAHMRAPLEDPIMEGFRVQLDRINAVADASPGFVWRLQTAAGNATGIRAYEDPRILFNLSVWESIEALHAYVYQSEHVGPLRNRRSWFQPIAAPILVLWWAPAGHRPTIDEAKARLALLEAHGATAEAFTFRHPFPSPGQTTLEPPEVDAAFCEWAS